MSLARAIRAWNGLKIYSCICRVGLTLGMYAGFWISVSMPALGAEQGVHNELDEFLKLNEGLPRAVCDEASISKAPTLEALGSTRPGSQGVLNGASRVQLEAKMTEGALISFLLGDSQSMVPSPGLEASSEKSHALVKRKLSLDICVAMVTPGELQKVLTRTPSWFIHATPVVSESRPQPSLTTQAKTAWIRASDREGRFGHIGRKWWVPGWLEPHEVTGAWYAKREYKRFANPITNLTQFIEIVGKGSQPLGFLYPTDTETELNWEGLKLGHENQAFRARKLETYRNLIEGDAYQAISVHPSQAEAIRKLQEFYRNLLGAYLIYPDDAQFVGFAKLAGPMLGEKEIRQLLDTSFVAELKAARVNGAKVGLGLLAPDPKLQGLYREYRKRLAKVGPALP